MVSSRFYILFHDKYALYRYGINVDSSVKSGVILVKVNTGYPASNGGLKEGDIVYLEKKKKKYQGIQDTYRVRKGETLYGVSQQFGIQMASLAKLNGIDIFSILREGDVLSLQ